MRRCSNVDTNGDGDDGPETRWLLATLALREAAPRSFWDSIGKHHPSGVLIQVPTRQWVSPVAEALSRLISPEVSILRQREGKDSDLATILTDNLSDGDAVVLVATGSPQLPMAFESVLTRKVKIQTSTATMLNRVLARQMRGRARLKGDLVLKELDFDDLCALLPRGGSSRVAVMALEKHATSGRKTSRVRLPILEEAIEFGKARDWGLELRRDLLDYQNGDIGWEDVDRGAVLFGPPGTGKTLFAQVLAEGCGVPIQIASMADLFASSRGYLDSVIKAQRELFARALTHTPSILFLDEIDQLPDLDSLDSRHQQWWSPVVADFLLLLDSAVSQRDGLVVIGATNRIDSISPAVLRPGRLERAIPIDLPSPTGIERIIRHHVGNGDSIQTDLSNLAVAAASQGATGAIIMEWVRAAKRHARTEGRQISLLDLERQVLGTDQRSNAERWLISVHEAGHAVVAVELGLKIAGVSILSNDGVGGSAVIDQNAATSTNHEIEKLTCFALAGRAAEKTLLGEVSIGSGGGQSSDLHLATRLMFEAHCRFGLRGELAWRGETAAMQIALSTDRSLRASIEQDLQRLEKRAIEIVARRRDQVKTLARALMKSRLLGGDEIQRLLAGGNHEH